MALCSQVLLTCHLSTKGCFSWHLLQLEFPVLASKAGCSSQPTSWARCGCVTCTGLGLSCSSHFAFFVSTRKEVLSRQDSSDWFLGLRVTKIMPFSSVTLSGVLVQNLIMLTHEFNVLLCLAWSVSTWSNRLCASLVLCRHFNTPEHGSRNPSLDTEVGIMFYFLSAGPFPGWLDW